MIAGLLFDRYRLAGDRRLVDRAAAAETAIVCGFLGCNLQPFSPLIATLPRLLHLRAPEDGGWIAQFMHQAVAESEAKRPGGEAMLARMSEMMFADAVRRYSASFPLDSAGWLAGLRDRLVGGALALLHVARMVRSVDRRATDAVSRPVAHATRGAHVARHARHGGDDRPRSGL